MIAQIDSPIRVGVIFEPQGRIKPVWFIWRGKRYEIKEITYTWSRRDGASLIQYFTVTDGANIYQISYLKNLSAWRLIALEDGG